MNKKMENKEVEELSYEEAFNELSVLIESLESIEHPLDEAVQLFERGQVLSQYCAKLLENAELKIHQISGDQLTELNK